MIEIFLLAFAALFVIIDPIGIAPISVSLLSGFDKHQKRKILLRAVLTSFAILAVFGLVGEYILEFTGIGMPAFRISGGFLLFLTALEILFQKRNARRQSQNQASDDAQFDSSNDPSIFPLAIPLIAGPGSMTSIILLMDRFEGDVSAQFIVFAALIVVLLLTISFAMAANKFATVIGDTGMQIINRLLGVLLAALSVQFIADGIFEYIKLSGAI